jgi:uncharacterized membrane protein
MKDWLVFSGENAIIIINAMALVIIAIGTIEAFFQSLLAFFRMSSVSNNFYAAYVRYARWLVAALTFLLAADILALSIAPTWDEIGIVAAIAVLRTFLSFFLERDLAEVEGRGTKSQETNATDTIAREA